MNQSYRKYLHIMKPIFYLFSFLLITASCTSDDDAGSSDPNDGSLYFPPITGDVWETTSPSSLGWDEQKLSELHNFLEQNETRAFIVLVDGKIVTEQYWNNDLLGQPFDASKQWYWASASKSLTGMMVGVAQEDGLLDINDKTSDYLGTGWTAMPQAKEDLITIRNQLTFTTGIDYNVTNLDCTDPSCLNYLNDAGSQWFYHNATYTLVKDLLEVASNGSLNDYTDSTIENPTGMSGTWLPTPGGFASTYFSDARSAARFGLLTLNNGTWDETPVLEDQSYFNDMVNTSQSLNPSYGYLWWLNGKGSAVFPGLTTSFPIDVTPNGPNDMIMALGRDGQFIDVIPSMNMVLIRMGDEPSGSLVPVTFHDELWERFNEVLP